MPVEGVCTIPGRGTVVTGRVERGVLAVQDEVEVIGRGDEVRRVVVTGIQEFHHDVPRALAGHNVGLLLRGLSRDARRARSDPDRARLGRRASRRASRGVLALGEGRRSEDTLRFRLHAAVLLGATDVPGTLRIPSGVLAPGARGEIEFELARAVALEPGMRFAMREGGHTVGAGVVSRITAQVA